jgi:hypothetical protein
MFMRTAHAVSQEMRSFVRTFDLGRFWRAFEAKSPRITLAEQCDEYFDDVWFMQHARIFPALQFALMEEVPRAYILQEEPYPATSMFSGTNRQRQASERERIDAVHESNSSPMAEQQFRFARVTPLLFSAHGSSHSSPVSLLGHGHMSTSNLMYLDISYTKTDIGSFHGLSQICTGFPNVRVLKMRGLRLFDWEFARISLLFGKLWSLDLTDNSLTDVVFPLLVSAFMLGAIEPRVATINLPDEELFDDVPHYVQDAHRGIIETTVALRPDSSDKFMEYIENHSTFPAINDQVLDDHDPLLRRTGLTQLYISNNKLTSHGVKKFLTKANRLQVLDVGSVETVWESGLRSNYGPGTVAYQQPNTVFAISRDACSRMENLRIHHSLVTCVSTVVRIGSPSKCFTLELLERAEKEGLKRVGDLSRFPERYKVFSPLENHRISKLTLTDLPTKSFGLTIKRLIEFLEDCRIQEERLNQARYFTKKSRRAPQLLPGLRILRLEFIPEDTRPQSPDWGGSVSGDRDADNFLASSEGDFSFFDDPKTMSSVSRRGSVTRITTGSKIVELAMPASRKGSIMGGGLPQRAMSTLSRPSSAGSGSEAPSNPPPYVAQEAKDVVEELKKYRAAKERKWTGDLQLVFPHGR